MNTLARQELTTFYLVLGLLIGAVMVGGIVLLAVRRRLLQADSPRHESLMEQLRRMHKSGNMTTEEYDRTRKAMARAAAGMAGASGATTAPRQECPHAQPANPAPRTPPLGAADQKQQRFLSRPPGDPGTS